MTSDERLARLFLSSHPEVAARLLESMDAEDASEVLKCTPAAVAAPVLRHMLPTSSAHCAELLSARAVAELLEQLPALSAAALLRHFPPAARDDTLKQVRPAKLAALKLLLRYPATAVGAWMEPRVLTLPHDCSLREARARLERAEHSHPKIYVLDRNRHLRGAVNRLALLRNGLLGPVTELLTPIDSIWARESVASAQERDIWEKESEAPVVNRQDEFVGIVTYADLRRGHRQLVRPAQSAGTDQGVGDLAELFIHGLEDTWLSLGEIMRSEMTDPPGKPR